MTVHRAAARFCRTRLGAAVASVFCVLLVGCGGSHAEYVADSLVVGARLEVGSGMAYVTNLPEGYGDKEILRIGRALTTATNAENDKRSIRVMRDNAITPIPAGTVMEVIAVFTVVQDGLKRLFVDDYDVAVLRDDKGVSSTVLLIEIFAFEKEARLRFLSGAFHK